MSKPAETPPPSGRRTTTYREREKIKRQQLRWKKRLLRMPADQRAAMLEVLLSAFSDRDRAAAVTPPVQKKTLRILIDFFRNRFFQRRPAASAGEIPIGEKPDDERTRATFNLPRRVRPNPSPRVEKAARAQANGRNNHRGRLRPTEPG
jgi:hypothetical protein